MSLRDWAGLFLMLGLVIPLFGLFILLSFGTGGRSSRTPSIFTSKALRRGLIQDYEDKKVILGGPLGLVLWMIKIGILSFLIGGTLYLINWIFV